MTPDKKKSTPNFRTWKHIKTERYRESKSSQGGKIGHLQRTGLLLSSSPVGRQMMEEQYLELYWEKIDDCQPRILLTVCPSFKNGRVNNFLN